MENKKEKYVSEFMSTDIEDQDRNTEFEICYKTAVKSNGLICLYEDTYPEKGDDYPGLLNFVDRLEHGIYGTKCYRLEVTSETVHKFLENVTDGAITVLTKNDGVYFQYKEQEVKVSYIPNNDSFVVDARYFKAAFKAMRYGKVATMYFYDSPNTVLVMTASNRSVYMPQLGENLFEIVGG